MRGAAIFWCELLPGLGLDHFSSEDRCHRGCMAVEGSIEAVTGSLDGASRPARHRGPRREDNRRETPCGRGQFSGRAFTWGTRGRSLRAFRADLLLAPASPGTPGGVHADDPRREPRDDMHEVLLKPYNLLDPLVGLRSLVEPAAYQRDASLREVAARVLFAESSLRALFLDMTRPAPWAALWRLSGLPSPRTT